MRTVGLYMTRTNLARSTVVKRTLSSTEQALMVEDIRSIIRSAPLVRPTTPGGQPMRVQVSAAGDLGWTGDGKYRYTKTQRTGAPWPEIPWWWRALASEVVQRCGSHVSPGHWDSAIINWYAPGSSLGWHVDRSEADATLPIVTFSLGDSCSWAVRRPGEKPSRCQLDSGAITVLMGECRSLEHSVERLIGAPLLSPLSVRGRLSVTLRVAG